LERGRYTWNVWVSNVDALPNAEFVEVIEVEPLDMALK
jgi:hypothetical protein